MARKRESIHQGLVGRVVRHDGVEGKVVAVTSKVIIIDTGDEGTLVEVVIPAHLRA